MSCLNILVEKRSGCLHILCLKQYLSKVRSDPAHPHHLNNILAQTSVSGSGRQILPQKQVCPTVLNSKNIFLHIQLDFLISFSHLCLPKLSEQFQCSHPFFQFGYFVHTPSYLHWH